MFILGSNHGLHGLYKREVNQDFCGLDLEVTAGDLLEAENGVHEDVFVTGQQLAREGDLIVS